MQVYIETYSDLSCAPNSRSDEYATRPPSRLPTLNRGYLDKVAIPLRTEGGFSARAGSDVDMVSPLGRPTEEEGRRFLPIQITV